MPASIPVLGKAIQLLHHVAEDEGSTSQAVLARELSLAPATCHRILKTFIAFDWIRALPAGGYGLSLGLLPLLRSLGDYQRVFDQFRGPLERLVEHTGLTAKISVRQGDRSVTVFRMESPRDLFPSSKIGASFPLAYGSSGACLLSDLSDADIEHLLTTAPAEAWKLQEKKDVWERIRAVRADGVCHDAGHYHARLHSLSAPVIHPDGGVFCALTLLGWPEDFDGGKAAEHKKQVKAAAQQCRAILTPTTPDS